MFCEAISTVKSNVYISQGGCDPAFATSSYAQLASYQTVAMDFRLNFNCHCTELVPQSYGGTKYQS
jgi:hypothetical protein